MRALLVWIVVGILAGLPNVGSEAGGLAKHATASRASMPSASRPIVTSDSSIGQIDHRCADLFVETQVRLAVVPGVWACLEPRVQALYKGTGDAALLGSSPYFIEYRFIGCDRSICVYSLSFEATTAGKTGISDTTMTVWLDHGGLVSHAAIPKPIP